ncbi:MAG: hypothetical protein ACREXK_09030 [Gammaproteobacteria bacterium]
MRQAHERAGGKPFTSRRAERELGYRFRPAEEALAEAIAWFRESGYLR